MKLNSKFLVIGDVMLDRYVYGATKMAPETVVDFRPNGTVHDRIGGAGNVVAQLSGLGGGDFITGVGNDQSGGRLKVLLKELNFTPHYMDIPVTTTKTRFVDEVDDKFLFRLSDELMYEPKLLLEKIDESPEVVVISDYDKGVLHEQSISEIIARFDDLPIIVNPKEANVYHYRGVDCLIVNELEARVILGIFGYIEPVALTSLLYERLEADCVIITFGRLGACYRNGYQRDYIETIEREVVDATGAGDTFFSVISMLWGHYDTSQMIYFANLLAGHCVQTLGNSVLSKQEVIRLTAAQLNKPDTEPPSL